MDFVKDNNPTAVYLVNSQIGTPDFVNDSDVITEESLTKFADVAFADTANREYPIFNKAATWLSYTYYCGTGTTNDKLENTIKQAAKALGITERTLHTFKDKLKKRKE